MVSGCMPLLSVCVLMFPAKFVCIDFFWSHLRKISWALYGWTDWLVNIKRAYSKIAAGGYFRFRDLSISNKPIRWPRAWLKWTNQELCMHKIQSWIPNFLQGANWTRLFSIDKWVTPELCLVLKYPENFLDSLQGLRGWWCTGMSFSCKEYVLADLVCSGTTISMMWLCYSEVLRHHACLLGLEYSSLANCLLFKRLLHSEIQKQSGTFGFAGWCEWARRGSCLQILESQQRRRNLGW